MQGGIALQRSQKLSHVGETCLASHWLGVQSTSLWAGCASEVGSEKTSSERVDGVVGRFSSSVDNTERTPMTMSRDGRDGQEERCVW